MHTVLLQIYNRDMEAKFTVHIYILASSILFKYTFKNRATIVKKVVTVPFFSEPFLYSICMQ